MDTIGIVQDSQLGSIDGRFSGLNEQVRQSPIVEGNFDHVPECRRKDKRIAISCFRLCTYRRRQFRHRSFL